ncbi:class I SAM-dependent methyltransferase [Gordonia sp. VNK1]|uniref:class I SAM-dependent methyltransferase n=1 Tax=Gordonia oleivorans TaxID=3156618 RepID=UPI0032B40A9E
MAALPPHARTALDVGTGDGLLAVELRERIPEVVAIDIDESVLDRARSEAKGIEWIRGDVMDHRFGRTFDVVASVATLHHLPDLSAAFRRLSDLTSPGGTLVTVGLARPTRISEHGLGLLGVAQHRWLSLRRGHWEHSAPTVWPPPHSYTEVRQCAMRELPGAQWKLLPLFRYAVTWHKPMS